MNRTITNSNTRSAPPLIRPASWRCHLGLYGAGRQEAAASGIRVDQVPQSHRHVTKVIQECNWLQGLEGGIDTSHAQILHRDFTPTIGPNSRGARGGAPTV